MIHTMRWFGPHDLVSLMDIRQSGCTGVVTALHQIPVGQLWTIEDINARKELIEKDNLTHTALHWAVVESLPVHEDIKKGLPSRDHFIEQYKASLANLAACGIDTVCYNFMPVLDWSRTNLSYQLPDGAIALRFVWEDFALFDLFILRRPNAALDYTPDVREMARAKFESLDPETLAQLSHTVLLGLPGSEEAFDLNTFQGLLDQYKHIDEQILTANLHYFISEVAPYAQKLGIKLCIHPDDPPFPLMGLPRVVSTEKHLQDLMNACDVPANGITFCTGSLGVRADNNLPAMIRKFSNRIHFLHLRSTLREAEAPELIFHEAPHLFGDVDMYGVIKEIAEMEKSRGSLPMRPDHGHQILDDVSKKTYPGYSGIGRLKGLAEIRGLELAISKL